MRMAARGRFGVAMVAVALLTLFPGLSVQAAEPVAMPFVGGKEVRIIQGYSGGTHQGRSQFGLDLVLAGGGTSGAEVLAPINGRVGWAQAPGSGTGCLSITMSDGSYSV